MEVSVPRTYNYLYVSSELWTQTREVFQCLAKKGQKSKKKADIEYPFEHGEVINYTLDGVLIHSKIQASFPSQLPEKKETAQGFHHEANGDFKTVKLLMAVIGENWGWDQ